LQEKNENYIFDQPKAISNIQSPSAQKTAMRTIFTQYCMGSFLLPVDVGSAVRIALGKTTFGESGGELIADIRKHRETHCEL
jgi:hypothetical protein